MPLLRRTLAASLLVALPAAAGAAPQAAPFQDVWLQPYLTAGLAGEARRALQAQRPAQAARLLRRYLRLRQVKQRQQARFLLAHALLQSKAQKDLAQAAQLFTALITDYPRLRQYCRYYAAKAHYRQRQFAAAEQLAAAVPVKSAIGQDAQLLLADALRAQGRLEQGAAIWQRYLQQRPGGGQVGQAHLYIAEAREKQAQAAAGPPAQALWLEALEHYKQVLIKAPLWHKANQAQKGLERAAARLAGQPALTALSVPQAYAQAIVFYQANRNERAEASLAELLQQSELADSLRCKASFYLANSVFKQRQRARAAPLFAVAEQACRKAGDADLVVKSLYNGGRGLAASQQPEAAISRFGVIEKEYASHSYADDARLWAAEIYEKQGKDEQVVAALSSLPQDYPQGDMAREALWRLARKAYLDKRYDQALAYLEQTLTRFGRARYYYAEGQALYWRGRILALTGKPQDAAASYEQCLREYPLSYYALLAFNRLREGHPRRYRVLYQELIAPVGQRAGQWSFAPRALYRRSGFLRGLELARLGFDDQAARELNRVGLRVRKGEAEGDLWLTAVLYDRAGLWRLSHQVARSIDTGYRRGYPLGESYRRWAIGYPRAFHPLVPQSARQAGLPWELVQSVMREESGFSTTIESYANAVGLMQLILPTAKAAGSQHRIEVDRQRLHDPAVNIKLGATYLGFLYRSFGLIPLTIAGYNAGEGAAYRWVKQFGQVPLDELIERIPYDQTRRYTKRVLSTFFTYSLLYGRGQQRIPRLGQRIGEVKLQPFSKAAPKRKRGGKKQR